MQTTGIHHVSINVEYLKQKGISALVLTGILCLCTGLIPLHSATAAPTNSIIKGNGYAQASPNNSRPSGLPGSVANAVRQDLSRKVKIPASKLKITQYSQKTWPDGCLGIPSNEFCTRALVEGWRITLSNGNQTWVYRTDNQGKVIRLEQLAFANLPAAVADAVLQDASGRSGLPISSLRIVKAERRTWTNGCLGLGGPGVVCTQALVPGWQVIVEGGKQRLVYRTGESGRVRLDEAASQIGEAGIKPI